MPTTGEDLASELAGICSGTLPDAPRLFRAISDTSQFTLRRYFSSPNAVLSPEDLSQDILVRLVRAHNAKPYERVGFPLLSRIGRQVIIDNLRKSKHSKNKVTSIEDLADLLADPDANDQILLSDLLADVARVVTPRKLQCLRLALRGLEQQEIAKELGIGQAAVSEHMRDLKVLVNRLLFNLDPDPDNGGNGGMTRSSKNSRSKGSAKARAVPSRPKKGPLGNSELEVLLAKSISRRQVGTLFRAILDLPAFCEPQTAKVRDLGAILTTLTRRSPRGKAEALPIPVASPLEAPERVSESRETASSDRRLRTIVVGIDCGKTSLLTRLNCADPVETFDTRAAGALPEWSGGSPIFFLCEGSYPARRVSWFRDGVSHFFGHGRTNIEEESLALEYLRHLYSALLGEIHVDWPSPRIVLPANLFGGTGSGTLPALSRLRLVPVFHFKLDDVVVTEVGGFTYWRSPDGVGGRGVGGSGSDSWFSDVSLALLRSVRFGDRIETAKPVVSRIVGTPIESGLPQGEGLRWFWTSAGHSVKVEVGWSRTGFVFDVYRGATGSELEERTGSGQGELLWQAVSTKKGDSTVMVFDRIAAALAKKGAPRFWEVVGGALQDCNISDDLARISQQAWLDGIHESRMNKCDIVDDLGERSPASLVPIKLGTAEALRDREVCLDRFCSAGGRSVLGELLHAHLDALRRNVKLSWVMQGAQVPRRGGGSCVQVSVLEEMDRVALAKTLARWLAERYTSAGRLQPKKAAVLETELGLSSARERFLEDLGRDLVVPLPSEFVARLKAAGGLHFELLENCPAEVVCGEANPSSEGLAELEELVESGDGEPTSSDEWEMSNKTPRKAEDLVN